MTPEISYGIPLVCPSTGGLEDASLDTIEGVGLVLSISLGCPLLPESSSSTVLGAILVLSSSRGGTSNSQMVSETPSFIPLQISSTELGNKLTPEWEYEIGLSQIQDLPFVYDHNWEEAWKKVDELWERVSAMYTMIEVQRKKHLAIWGEMIECQKRERKRELQNLQSYVNYGDIKASSKCRKGKAHML